MDFQLAGFGMGEVACCEVFSVVTCCEEAVLVVSELNADAKVILRKCSIENDWFVHEPFFSIVVKSFDAQGNMLSFRCSMGMTEIQECIFDRKIG